MAVDQLHDRGDPDPTESRKRRVDVLKGLVAECDYDVPAEDVADRIIRDVIVIAAPVSRR